MARLRTLLFVACSPAALGACNSAAPGAAVPAAVAPVEYTLTAQIAAGSEVERCKFVRAPAEGLFINKDEITYTPGSHHVLLYETSYTDVPTKNDDGVAVDTSGVFDCSSGATNGWSVTRVVSGSQNPSGDSSIIFPPDVAVHVPPNAVLLLNAHYINTSTDVRDSNVSVKLHLIPEAQMKTEGDVLFLYNIFIKLNPQAKADARMRCPVHKDITLTTAQSHMHARGVDYSAQVNGDAPFYTNAAWSDVPIARLNSGEGIEIKAGSMIDYHCAYTNTLDHAIFQGPRTTDEMCMLIGSYYPVDRATSSCSADPKRAPQTKTLGAEWVGSGTATCAESAKCFQAAQTSDMKQSFENIMGCVTASDPAVSKELSDALRCIFVSSQDGKDAQTVCASQIAACIVK